MPFGKCPICGMEYHLQETDHAQWYKDRGLEFGALLIEKCFLCWQELKPSDRVRVLRPPDDSPGISAGDIGYVMEVMESSGDKRYRVEAESPAKWVASFEREAITCAPRGQQPIGVARDALRKHGMTLRRPEPSYLYCTIGADHYKDINVHDLYENYAHWKLTPEELLAEIRKRLGR